MNIFLEVPRILFLVSLVGLLVLGGCSGDDGPSNASGNMEILSITSQGTIQCEGETCAERFEVELQDQDKDPSMYYWVRFLGPVDICSNPVRDTSLGITIHIPVDIYYYAKDPNGLGISTFQVHAFKSKEYSHACSNKWEDGIDYDGIVDVDMIGWGQNCGINCCSRPGPDSGRFHAQIWRDTIGVSAASAKIRAKYGILCKEVHFCCEQPAHENAFVSIHNNQDETNPLWVETGYRRFIDTTGIIDKGWYGEIYYNGLHAIWTNPNWIVESNDAYTYEIELYEFPGVNAVWVWKLDGIEHPDSWDQNVWLGKQGTSVYFGGEIVGYESDMPGTTDDRCVFSDCKFRSIYLSGWQSMNFYRPGTRIGGDNLDEWKLERIDEGSFGLFDNSPNSPF